MWTHSLLLRPAFGQQLLLLLLLVGYRLLCRLQVRQQQLLSLLLVLQMQLLQCQGCGRRQGDPAAGRIQCI